MNDKSQETDFLYNVGDCVTFNDDRSDDVVEYAIIVGRNIIGSNRAYKVIWLDNLCEVYGGMEYEYLENQIKKVQNNV